MNRTLISVPETEDWRDHLRNIKIDHEKNIDNIVKNFVDNLLKNDLGKYLEIIAKTSDKAKIDIQTKLFFKINNFIIDNKPGKLLAKYFNEWGLRFENCGFVFEFYWG